MTRYYEYCKYPFHNGWLMIPRCADEAKLVSLIIKDDGLHHKTGLKLNVSNDTHSYTFDLDTMAKIYPIRKSIPNGYCTYDLMSDQLYHDLPLTKNMKPFEILLDTDFKDAYLMVKLTFVDSTTRDRMVNITEKRNAITVTSIPYPLKSPFVTIDKLCPINGVFIRSNNPLQDINQITFKYKYMRRESEHIRQILDNIDLNTVCRKMNNHVIYIPFTDVETTDRDSLIIPTHEDDDDDEEELKLEFSINHNDNTEYLDIILFDMHVVKYLGTDIYN